MKRVQILILSGEVEEINETKFSKNVLVKRSEILGQDEMSLEKINLFIDRALNVIVSSITEFCADHLPSETNKIVARRLERIKSYETKLEQSL